MDLTQFKDSLPNEAPPADIGSPLQALWHERKGDWTAAHDLLQEESSQEGSWVHAYLHRVEGDIPNARYWYARAGRTLPEQSLEEEWEAIAQTLLANA